MLSRFISPLQVALTSSVARAFSTQKVQIKSKVGTPEYYRELEHHYGCHNYHPIPAVIERGQGLYVWDVNGKKYMDFLAAYSAVNQGHCHPRIKKAMIKQLDSLTLISRAFNAKNLGICEKYLTELFKYDKVLMMNTGCEGTESAVKFARRWAYTVKGVPDNQARVVFCLENFWGRSIAACGSSEDPDRNWKFGPFDGLNFDLIPYNDAKALEEKLASDPNIAAFVVEPIQGEAGVKLPLPGYLKKVSELCKKYNVLLITDEIQCGLGRSGELLAHLHDGIRPDMVVLGKALSGGFYPVSCVLADNQIMDQIKPGHHGSTYGGNPLATAVCMEAMKVLIEEKMVENSKKMGEYLLKQLKGFKKDYIKDVRGRGLFCAMEFQKGTAFSAYELCVEMMKNGVLAKPTHDTTIRLTPPLIVKKNEIDKALELMEKSMKTLETKSKAKCSTGCQH